MRLAQALIAADDVRGVDEAIVLARKSLVEDPNPQAYHLLGNGYSKKGKLPEVLPRRRRGLFP